MELAVGLLFAIFRSTAMLEAAHLFKALPKLDSECSR